MIAQRLSADIRWVVVASPAYLERFGYPTHPDDLQAHRCVRIKAGDDRIIRWELERGDQRLEVDVPGSLIVDQAQIGLAAVMGGATLMYVPEPVVAQLVQEGVLRIVLEEWASPGPGFYLYYSSRHHVPPGLASFIEVIRELRPLGF
jgi:DNA-binding transcriptional LysR family regulator